MLLARTCAKDGQRERKEEMEAVERDGCVAHSLLLRTAQRELKGR